jgi:hypothetical protein
MQRIQAIARELRVAKEPLRVVTKRLFPQPRVVVYSPLPNGHDGLYEVIRIIIAKRTVGSGFVKLVGIS